MLRPIIVIYLTVYVHQEGNGILESTKQSAGIVYTKAVIIRTPEKVLNIILVLNPGESCFNQFLKKVSRVEEVLSKGRGL